MKFKTMPESPQFTVTETQAEEQLLLFSKRASPKTRAVNVLRYYSS